MSGSKYAVVRSRRRSSVLRMLVGEFDGCLLVVSVVIVFECCGTEVEVEVEGDESMSLERAAQAVDWTVGKGDLRDLEKSLWIGL